LTRNKGKYAEYRGMSERVTGVFSKFCLVSRRSSARQETGRQKNRVCCRPPDSGLVAGTGQRSLRRCTEGDGVRSDFSRVLVTKSAAVGSQPSLDGLKCLDIILPSADSASVDGLVGSVIRR